MPTTLANDTFTDSDSTAIDSHTSDSAHSWSLVALTGFASGSQNALITSNELRISNTLSGMAAQISESSSADGEISSTVTLDNQDVGTFGGLFFRRTDADNYWIALVRYDALIVECIESGSVASTTTVSAAHGESAQSLTVTLSGASITVTTSEVQASISNSTHQSATGYGVFGIAGVGGIANVIDDFAKTDDTSPPLNPTPGGAAVRHYLTMMGA